MKKLNVALINNVQYCKFPKEINNITFETIITRKTMDNIKEYLSDQFPFREELIKLKNRIETMLKKNILFLSLLSLLFLASCTSYKKVPYIQNSDEWAKMEQAIAVHEPRIMPGDMLNILVTNPDNPFTSMSYNLVSPADISSTSRLIDAIASSN